MMQSVEKNIEVDNNRFGFSQEEKESSNDNTVKTGLKAEINFRCVNKKQEEDTFNK